MVKVVKASGRIESYSRDKVVASIVKSGVEERVALKLVRQLEKDLPERVTTDEIHRRVVELLRRESPREALKYSLRRGIMKLGPSGYPFEKYFAKLLEALGYSTKTNVVLEGRCVTHEIDVIAVKGGVRYMIECKYHNTPGTYTGVQVALYTYARFLDLAGYFDMPWIVTNTKISNEAAKYASCVGMRVTAWGYPYRENLEEIVERTGLYPVTVLFSLTEEARRRLLEAGVVTVEDLRRLGPKEISSVTGMPREAAEKILEETKLLLVA